MRGLVAVQFESIADDAMLISDQRVATRRVISTCLEEWAVPPRAFKTAEEALERALRDHRIPSGAPNFPYISDLSFTRASPPDSPVSDP